jgi:thiol:disulfide interchange protein DsbD
MRLMRRFVFGLLLVLAALPSRAAHTQARLVLSHESAKPGEIIMVGIHLKMDKGWHTYWRNGGDSGAPTSIEWTLPKGVTAGEIQWPLPEKYSVEGETTFIYHDEAVLLVPLKLDANLQPGKLELKAKVSWLECEKACVPGEATVNGTLANGDTKPSADAAAFDAWREKIPQPKPDHGVRARWESAAKGDSRPLLIEWTADKLAKETDFFPYESDKFTVQAATETVRLADGEARLRKAVNKLSDWPQQISGVLVERGEGGKLLGARDVTIAIKAVAGAAQNPAASDGSAAIAQNKPLPLLLGAAFLGGLILNLMPCVLPVLALKVLSFVQQTQESPARVRALSLVYGAGVTVSFLILAGIAIAVRATQGSFSWGQQFQNPQFLVAITTLVTLMALNLFGVFEITLGSGAMGAASQIASKEGAAGAFFNGVVAVVLGTSCTAPFLGLALGYALYRSPLEIVLTFVAVGAGLAFPYVALSFFPALRRFLPKPGLWMERFKVALGFPVLGTGVWLLSQMPTHFGKGGALWVGLFLLTVAVAAWIFGQFIQRGTSRKGLAAAAAVLLLAGGYAVALEHELNWRSPKDADEWQPWSTAAVESARAAARPVFVDFTADWCLNCKLNFKSSINIPSVRKRLDEIKAVTLLGDFTRKNPAIAAELKRHERAGVPLVLVYPKDATKPPIVLPELLTPSIVLDALDQAAK